MRDAVLTEKIGNTEYDNSQKDARQDKNPQQQATLIVGAPPYNVLPEWIIMSATKSIDSPPLAKCLINSLLSFASMIPMIIGVIALVAMLQTLISPEKLVSFFTGNSLIDTLIGTACGAIAAGNPIVSYLLGGELLTQGVSLYAVSAFILAWVTLGVIQIPMEISAFGARFTLVRNLLAVFATIGVAILTSWTVELLR